MVNSNKIHKKFNLCLIIFEWRNLINLFIENKKLIFNNKTIVINSFLKYNDILNLINYKFITKKSIGPNVFYSITENGMTMLNLFMQKHD